MPKPRTKRQAIREERKRKRTERDETNRVAKRKRQDEPDDVNGKEGYNDTSGGTSEQRGTGGVAPPDREFFGLLSDQEQEYFRSVDEQLDLDDFPSQEDRNIYLANVFVEAQGKELKLACSQSCSRLLERLILMSNTRQKKRLFEQFGSHFLDLIQHRFASHCCETLFLRCAPVVSRELSGERDDVPTEEDGSDTQPLPLMEELFLLSLDELEGHLGYLLTDRFASHTLRVLLVVLSGRPLEQSATKSLVHSKKKEQISVPWTSNSGEDLGSKPRAIPASFTLAVKKIVNDSTAGMDATALRVLATHPSGNPVLQLLLELDISLNSEAAKGSSDVSLLWRLLPGAPASLKESASPASDFINTMMYDPVGSRLLETLVTHCPGKTFKVLFKHFFADRIQSLVRNDIASYPAIRALNRLSKEDLVAAVQKILPEIPKLLSLHRLNVIKTLFERCEARQAKDEINALVQALAAAYGSGPKDFKALVPKLCLPQTDEKEDEKTQQSLSKNQSALVSHGSHLTTTLLSIKGAPSNAIQASLLALPPSDLLSLATSSAPTSHVLTTAFETPASNKIFHKVIVAALMRNTMELARSQSGSKVLSAIISLPSKGDGINVPFHLKEQIMIELGQNEKELRDSFEGRRVWRAWRGDLWNNRRTDWIAWTKEVDSQTTMVPPWKKIADAAQANPNKIRVDEGARQRRGVSNIAA
jgi:nucleolar protein 9